MPKKSNEAHERRVQPDAWVDLHHEGREVTVGIECTDRALTFDGHFACLFPSRADEPDLSGAMARAEGFLEYLQGKKQMVRRG